MRTLLKTALLAAALLSVTACNRSHLEPPEIHGRPAMVEDKGQPRLWVLTKQEEVRQVAVGSGSRRISNWRSDTFFHFAVQAYDPMAAKPLWKKRLLTLGDPEARGVGPSRVIGSAVDARLLGQDGNVVWLLIGDAPLAVSAADGSIVADDESLQAGNPELKGLLPSEGKHYSFDRGLVLMTADARQFVVRGAGHKAVAYTPPVPAPEPPGPLKANGSPEMVPMRPIGEVPTRQVTLDGKWIGLYTEKEAADLLDDAWGGNLRWPYTVLNEGALARRVFWSGKIVTGQRFDDRFEHLAEIVPVAGSPPYLKGRFVDDPHTGAPRRLEDPAGVLVWHSTRIDSAGRLALTRLDASLKPVWKSELPLSETDFIHQLTTWHFPGHLVVIGELQTEDAGVTSRVPNLVSIDLATGAMRSMSLTGDGTPD